MAVVVIREELVPTGPNAHVRGDAHRRLEAAGVVRSLRKVVSFMLALIRKMGHEIVDGMREAAEMDRRLDAIRTEAELKSWNLGHTKPF